MDIRSLLRKNIAALEPYSTARDDYKGSLGIFLDANENPFDNGFNRYPDPRQKELKKQISSIKGVKPEKIFLGNGSDEAIDLCYRIFCEPGKSNCVAISPSYGMYKVCANINDVEMREVPLNDDFSLPVERLLGECDGNTRLMFICSPNNPTSNAFPMEEICALASGFNGILVVDEAYNDFSTKGSMLDKLDEYPNLIVLQTLSKAWGMANLRLGLGFMSEEISRYFSMVKYPYNISGLTQKTVSEILKKGNGEAVETVLSERKRVSNALESCSAVLKVYPSDANFLLVKTVNPTALYQRLVEKGVIVRDRSKCILCEGCLRITVGTPAENDAMMEVVRNFK